MVTALLVLALTGPVFPQDKLASEIQPPRRGDDVVVKGCLSGGALDSSEVTGRDKDDKPTRYAEFVTFRLTGDKKVLQQIRMEHSGHADIVKGELRSNLPKEGAIGGRIGNSRISIGIGRGMAPEAPPPLPVLEVTSFEHTGVPCHQD